MRQRFATMLFKASTTFGLLGMLLVSNSWAENQKFEATGIIAGGGQGILQLNVNGRPWLVEIDSRKWGNEAKTSVELKASANRELLKNLPAVRFPIMLDEKGKPAEPVESLTIFSPNRETRYGVFPAEFVNAAEKSPEKEQPRGERERRREEPAPRRELPDLKLKLPGKFYIVGQISRYRNGEFTVQIPTGRLSAVLADNAKVDLHVTDKTAALNMLQVGDTVSVKGFYQQVGTAVAQRIEANLDRQIGGEGEARKPLPEVAAVGPAIGEDVDLPKPSERFEVDIPEKPAAEPEAPQRLEILKIN